MNRNRIVIVTGGAGYIGSHACKALNLAGYIPVTIDNLSRGHASLVKWGPLEEVCILDEKSLNDVFAKYSPIAILHFAALAYVGESTADPILYYRNNVVGSLNILNCMIKNNVRNIVFSSTCATYGIPSILPILESAPQNPINPYGATKLHVERMIKDCALAHGLRYSILRYFNAAGCDAACETGEMHDPETHALPLAILAALNEGQPFYVFGDDYPTLDGTAVRDYIHVSDLADAHVKALRFILSNEGASYSFNLGNGAPISVLELVKAVERTTEKTVLLERVGRRSGDPAELYADATLARNVLDWTPKYINFDEIVATAVNWFTKKLT